MANTLNNPLTPPLPGRAPRHRMERRNRFRLEYHRFLDTPGREPPRTQLSQFAAGAAARCRDGLAPVLGYAPHSEVFLSGFFGEQTRKSKTAGHTEFPTRDWRYDTEDTVTTARACFRANRFPHRAIDLAVDYAYSNGTGDYGTTLEDVRSSFPSLISRHQSVDARLRYAWRPRTTVVLRYYFEHFRATDRAIDGIGQDGIRNVLTFGRSSPRYGNRLISLSIEARLVRFVGSIHAVFSG